MYPEARKLHLIEEVLKVKSETVLKEIEALLKKRSRGNKKKTSIYDFVGIFSKEETTAMREAIAETCEIIDDNEWK